MTLSPVRQPLVGSASSGQPAFSASTRAGRAGVVAGHDDRAGAEARGRRSSARGAWIEVPPTRAPRPRPTPSSGSSGSSSWTLRCTGRRCSCVRTKASSSSRSAVDDVERRREGPEDADLVGGLVGAGAPQPRRTVGRHDHQRDPGVRGLDHGRAAGWRRRCRTCRRRPPARPPTLARPSARKPAVRSSIRVCRRMPPGLRQRRTAAKDSGALRDPGASTTSRTPRAAQRRHDGPGELGRGVHEGRSCPTSASRACQWATRSAGARQPGQCGLVDLGPPDRQHPVDGEQRVGRRRRR